MPNELGLSADTESIMLARQLADQIMRGKRPSKGERIALAEGFQACDRQRMEAVRARQVALSEEERAALKWVRKYVDRELWDNTPAHKDARALAVLDRLTGGGK